ncbi:class I SAM-dependent methyltransferase [Ramlibacter rhizophilus]|uniref:Class I SAM-dependent methyltransferase n=1 Tax=Ramlibacter rhizophilus TaxID=1781167 RepID=A0A4Z0BCB5_9BURK|nr:class I SAM-dependent methyltransferase [Ramlibacter rhizophilus]TFY96872.1 class I SAM-dependent methyltransferase [Ramlibacter rhizophilus]
MNTRLKTWAIRPRPLMEIGARLLRSMSLRAPGFVQLLDDAEGESRGFVLCRGYRLPPKSMRGRMCGDAFRTDRFYVLSAVLEASKFSARLGGMQDARIVDIGSGLGRLATGLLAELPDVHYLGIDANEQFVHWCREHIEKLHPNFRFVHLDVANDLYNPGGTIAGGELRLPVDDASIDAANLWGVFTNMVPEHVRAYVAEIARILRPQGRCFLTAFAEDDVPEVTFNPSDYVPYRCTLPLTVVRYSKQWLFSTFQQHGLQLEEFRYHGTMFPKQSEIYLIKADTRLGQ